MKRLMGLACRAKLARADRSTIVAASTSAAANYRLCGTGSPSLCTALPHLVPVGIVGLLLSIRPPPPPV